MPITGDGSPPTGSPTKDDPVGGTASDRPVVTIEPPEAIQKLRGTRGPVVEEPVEIGDFKQAKGPSPSPQERTHTQIGAALAIIFSSTLCVMFGLHFGSVLYLAHTGTINKDTLEAVNHVFSTWVPVVSGFVASAVTFYYTQNKR